jgi:hypothetical protein
MKKLTKGDEQLYCSHFDSINNVAVVQRENTVTGATDSFTLAMPELYSYFEAKTDKEINISLNDACITYMRSTDYSDWTLTEN